MPLSGMLLICMCGVAKGCNLVYLLTCGYGQVVPMANMPQRNTAGFFLEQADSGSGILVIIKG